MISRWLINQGTKKACACPFKLHRLVFILGPKMCPNKREQLFKSTMHYRPMLRNVLSVELNEYFGFMKFWAKLYMQITMISQQRYHHFFMLIPSGARWSLPPSSKEDWFKATLCQVATFVKNYFSIFFEL